MTIETKGRIDWKPRLHMWRVIIYLGKWQEKKLGDYYTYDDAFWALRELVGK